MCVRLRRCAARQQRSSPAHRIPYHQTAANIAISHLSDGRGDFRGSETVDSEYCFDTLAAVVQGLPTAKLAKAAVDTVFHVVWVASRRQLQVDGSAPLAKHLVLNSLTITLYACVHSCRGHAKSYQNL